jgi:hypothetical protein
VFGLLYRWRTRKLPKEERVSALAFVPLSLLMPITYAMLTPLALFTLDTSNWETRNHDEAMPEGASQGSPIPVREAITAEIRVGDPAPAVARARSHAQLPAA